MLQCGSLEEQAGHLILEEKTVLYINQSMEEAAGKKFIMDFQKENLEDLQLL